MFSSRVPAHLEPNPLWRAVERLHRAGAPLIDLTQTNPTQAGFTYGTGLFRPLSSPAVGTYAPSPLGLEAARRAVSIDYGRRGIHVPPERIVLTPSTSDAYSLLFKLLCAPHGDSVLVPAPSYPLFEHLTRLDGVRAVHYPLRYDGRWWVDVEALDARWETGTRAVLAVSPNNPTGSVVSGAEMAELLQRCSERDAALILDEVFADYPLGADVPTPPAELAAGLREPAALLFRLGGLSKSAGLPQLKLAWIGIAGPDTLADAAMQRLEFICDTYLSVSTPVQIAAPDVIEGGAAMRRQIATRVRSNYAALRRMAGNYPSVSVLAAEGGWSAVMRVPARGSEESIVLDLLDRDGVLVHPGYFFDFTHEAFVIVSLLPPPEPFLEGVRRVMERVHA